MFKKTILLFSVIFICACTSVPASENLSQNLLIAMKATYEDIESLRDYKRTEELFNLELREKVVPYWVSNDLQTYYRNEYALLKSNGLISHEGFAYGSSKGVRIAFRLKETDGCITKEMIEKKFQQPLRWFPPIHPSPIEHGRYSYRNSNATVYFNFGKKTDGCMKNGGIFREFIDITKR